MVEDFIRTNSVLSLHKHGLSVLSLERMEWK